MKFILLILITISSSSFAKDCLYSISKKDIKMVWTAFKTPLKKGVPGSFDNYGIKESFKGNSLKQLLTTISFDIDTKSVNTNNEARDAKIAKFFFGKMAGSKISGKFKSYSKKILNVEISMNGVTRDVPLAVKIDSNQLTASGHIDVLDFSLAKSLAGINKACLELHQGKTWSDVALELTARFSESCK